MTRGHSTVFVDACLLQGPSPDKASGGLSCAFINDGHLATGQIPRGLSIWDVSSLPQVRHFPSCNAALLKLQWKMVCIGMMRVAFRQCPGACYRSCRHGTWTGSWVRSSHMRLCTVQSTRQCRISGDTQQQACLPGVAQRCCCASQTTC